MNKSNQILIWLMLAAVGFLTGCEKMPADEATLPSSPSTGENIVIQVSGIDAGWGGNSTRSLVDISEVCSRVCFAVYQDGTRVASKNQKTGDTNFGSYTVSLGAGGSTPVAN